MNLVWIWIVLILELVSVHGKSYLAGQRRSEFLKNKFANYDKSVRPYFGQKPVTVTVSGYVLDIFGIDEVKQEFTVNLYLRHEWRDPRLEFTETETGTDKIFLNQEYANKLWLVDSFIKNERESKGHELLVYNQVTRLSADGTVLISTRFTIRSACKMELGWFPFDRHTCPMIIESCKGFLNICTCCNIDDGHTTRDIVYQWKTDTAKKFGGVGVSKELSSIRFHVAALNTRQETISLLPKSYSKLAVEFFFIRASARFVHEVYLPAIILTLLSFVTLIFSTGTPQTRLQISIFLEGFLILLMAISARTMPPVGYQTALDFYLFICLLTTSCMVAINVIICQMIANESWEFSPDSLAHLRYVNDEHNGMEDYGKQVFFDTTAPRFLAESRINRAVRFVIRFRFILPLIFMAFNLLYWMTVLIGSSSFPDDFLILESLHN